MYLFSTCFARADEGEVQAVAVSLASATQLYNSATLSKVNGVG